MVWELYIYFGHNKIPGWRTLPGFKHKAVQDFCSNGCKNGALHHRGKIFKKTSTSVLLSKTQALWIFCLLFSQFLQQGGVQFLVEGDKLIQAAHHVAEVFLSIPFIVLSPTKFHSSCMQYQIYIDLYRGGP